MITDQIRQQENFLDAELKAAMINIALQALIDPEDFEKRFSQLPEEDKAIISEEFAKFCDEYEAEHKNSEIQAKIESIFIDEKNHEL